MKTCIICQTEKSLEEFHNKKAAKDGKQSQCKVCNIARVKTWQAENPEKHEAYWKYATLTRDNFKRRARTYGMQPEELQVMLDEADNRCAICGLEPRRWLVVDHCHTTNTVRGLLCEKCNTGIGHFDDDPDRLMKAIEYLNPPKH